MNAEVDGQRVAYIGPFEAHDVVFRGRQVPFLRSKPVEGGVGLTLDRRFGLRLSDDEAERVVPFLAHSIAVAMGYTCHPDTDKEPNPRHPFPRVGRLGG